MQVDRKPELPSQGEEGAIKIDEAIAASLLTATGLAMIGAATHEALQGEDPIIWAATGVLLTAYGLLWASRSVSR